MKQIFVLLICSCISLFAFADYLPSSQDPANTMHKALPAETQGVASTTKPDAECDVCHAFETPIRDPLVKNTVTPGTSGTAGDGNVEKGSK